MCVCEYQCEIESYITSFWTYHNVFYLSQSVGGKQEIFIINYKRYLDYVVMLCKLEHRNIYIERSIIPNEIGFFLCSVDGFYDAAKDFLLYGI